MIAFDGAVLGSLLHLTDCDRVHIVGSEKLLVAELHQAGNNNQFVAHFEVVSVGKKAG